MGAVIARRTVLAAPLLVAPAFTARGADAVDRLKELERRHGGRLGVAALDLATGRRLEHRARERFPMCSTFKVLAAAFVLHRVDRGEERLDRRIAITRADLVMQGGRALWSPVTVARADGEAMTVAEICEAAVALSDNTAANVLLAGFGGPAALTGYLRSLGDPVTRLDRIEPDLNEVGPGDPRDTTTPAAMLGTLRTLLVEDALSPASRGRLADWLVACRTGDNRLRAGFPKGWRVGDKTGTGRNGVVNDVAVAWRPDRAPLLVAAYFAGSRATGAERDAVIAEVGRIVSL